MSTFAQLDRPVPPSRLRVLIIEDAPSTMRFLQSVLGSVATFDIVGGAGTGYDAVRSAWVLNPDVVLLDLKLPDADGADILPDILQRLPMARVVVVSGTASLAGPALVAQGATGFIDKGLAPEELVRRLSLVLGIPLRLGPMLGVTPDMADRVVPGPVEMEHAPGLVDEETLAAALNRVAEVGRAKAGAEKAARYAAQAWAKANDAAGTGRRAPTEPMALPALSVPLRVLIVEDAPSTVRFLRAVLGSLASIDIVGDASTGQAAVRSAFLLGPDVILLDLSLPDTDGADILPYILQFLPETKVIVLSNNANVAGPDLVARGAIGFINKGLTPDDLVDELSVVLGASLRPGPSSDGPAMPTPPLPLQR